MANLFKVILIYGALGLMPLAGAEDLSKATVQADSICPALLTVEMPFAKTAQLYAPGYPWQKIWNSIAPHIEVRQRPYGSGFLVRKRPSWKRLSFHEVLIANQFGPRSPQEIAETLWTLATVMYEIRFTETFLGMRGGPTTIPWLAQPLGYARNVGLELHLAQTELVSLAATLQAFSSDFRPLPYHAECMPQASIDKKFTVGNKQNRKLTRSLFLRWWGRNIFNRAPRIAAACFGVYGLIVAIPHLPAEWNMLTHPEQVVSRFKAPDPVDVQNSFEQHLRFIQKQNKE